MLTLAATACDAFVTKFTERTQQALRQLSTSSLSLGIDRLTRLVAINLCACHPKTFLQQALQRIDSIEMQPRRTFNDTDLRRCERSLLPTWNLP